MIKVCLIGIGKTGKEIAKTLLDHNDIKLVSVVCSPNSSKNRKTLGAIHAINFIKNKSGFYEMSNILNLAKVIEDIYQSQELNAI
jgi:dihydrodipicolinate reductase